MINKFIVQGRISRDPQIKNTEKVKVAFFNVACVSSEIKDKTNFLDLKAFGKNAEVIEKYLPKGTQAIFEGYTSSGSYEKDGKKIFTQDMIVSKIYFFENKELNAKKEENKTNNNIDSLLFA